MAVLASKYHSRSTPKKRAETTDAGVEQSALWSLDTVTFWHEGASNGKVPVIKDISICLQPGCCYGILGPNGSGKTTLLDLLSGLYTPNTGQIDFLGQNLSAWPRKQLAQIMAVVPQDFSIKFGFTVHDVVEMGLHPHMGRFSGPNNEELERVEEILAETGIAHLANRSVTQLSGGEKQRVAVARALVQQPEVLLLDEATSNLDIHHALEVLHLIRQRFLRHKMQIVAVMHDINLAASFCDYLLFMKNGRIVCQGLTSEVLRPQIIADIYNVEARVKHNTFTDSLQASFRLAQSKLQ